MPYRVLLDLVFVQNELFGEALLCNHMQGEVGGQLFGRPRICFKQIFFILSISRIFGGLRNETIGSRQLVISGTILILKRSVTFSVRIDVLRVVDQDRPRRHGRFGCLHPHMAQEAQF